MKHSRVFLSAIISLLVAYSSSAFAQDNDTLLTYRVDPKKQELKLYWRNTKGQNFGSLQNLKTAVESNKQQLLFAMNGGMYKPDDTPVGLYIENGKTLSPLDTGTANGNFYLKPNGVFYITKNNTAAVCTTPNFKDNGQIKYATQSGPMLVINGEIHPALKESSPNKNIRNGVGILPDGSVLFVLSKQPVNFYDLANYFKQQGCKNALYLDGFVSRAYLPGKNWVQLDGEFGVMIGVARK
ncbi:phosphodiester glycosidase family protein [Mucilaginibacter pedocola]|uniref:Phosphodiester glycosidase domain-containing protein n=1 Tax=Mucilaginibacter pedocola TaxID=1792845 RepID=A0A1S9PCJ2_9SPHI|nr:phosphodiester glycosidase family protein [Mucilaginibacter pedocola]OOQ58702.1 hypothetical protein BC343_08540 [Mucilaginibacter pedocola]